MSQQAALSAFIQAAPPGELQNVTSAIQAITASNPPSAASLTEAYRSYNESQLTTVKLPGASESVLVSRHNRVEGEEDRYYDVESASSFAFDHATGKASGVRSHVFEGESAELVKSITKSLKTHVAEHYPSATFGVFPAAIEAGSDSAIAILIVANKYSPNNFWNGRWRSTYSYKPSTASLSGTIAVDVHYYEDGNVRLQTSKPTSSALSSSSAAAAAAAAEVVNAIATAERKYQEELSRGFSALSEGAFKSLRRQLPVTRQRMEWEKVSSYRVGQDIGGGR